MKNQKTQSQRLLPALLQSFPVQHKPRCSQFPSIASVSLLFTAPEAAPAAAPARPAQAVGRELPAAPFRWRLLLPLRMPRRSHGARSETQTEPRHSPASNLNTTHRRPPAGSVLAGQRSTTVVHGEKPAYL